MTTSALFSQNQPTFWRAQLVNPQATTQLASAIAGLAAPGLCILLTGPVGAGKSFLARAIIQTLMAQHSTIEDVPSPTFTLVQTYEVGPLDIWHADLYRLSSPDELIELGLEQAFDTALCLIEWPDRLDDLRPENAVEVTLTPATLHSDTLLDQQRQVEISGPKQIILDLQKAMEAITA